MHYGNTKKAERERQRRQATDLAQVAVLAAVHSGLLSIGGLQYSTLPSHRYFPNCSPPLIAAASLFDAGARGQTHCGS